MSMSPPRATTRIQPLWNGRMQRTTKQFLLAFSVKIRGKKVLFVDQLEPRHRAIHRGAIDILTSTGKGQRICRELTIAQLADRLRVVNGKSPLAEHLIGQNSILEMHPVATLQGKINMFPLRMQMADFLEEYFLPAEK